MPENTGIEAATDVDTSTGVRGNVPPGAPRPARKMRDAVGLGLYSRLGLVLAIALLAGTFFLISPPPEMEYPGALPWGSLSVLRGIIGLMSLGGLVKTARGVEIKDLVLYLATAGALVLVGLRALSALWADKTAETAPNGLARTLFAPARTSPGARLVSYAQMLLAGWVLLSFLSSLWSTDPAAARGQGLIYAFGLGWAVALAALLNWREIERLLYALVVVCAGGAALCIWYYYERNPYHRPGFPLGNPNVISAAMVPGILMALAILAAAASGWLQGTAVRPRWPVLIAPPVLAAFAWCLALARGRGAFASLAVGLVAVGVLLARRRVRWILAVVAAVGLTIAGAWLFYTPHLELTMGRGQSIRLRLYAWRYAAELWGLHPVAGSGAGAYPRLAGALPSATRDEALDPAAFMGEIVEHAHNELFEVLTEIGLVGGVTFVGGFVATVFATTALLRATPRGPRRWLILGLAGSVTALLADSMTGPNLRLPGVPAIFYTLLGLLWAVCAMLPDEKRAAGAGIPVASAASRRPHVTEAALGVVCLAAAGAAVWLAARNWSGLCHEQAAARAMHAETPDWVRALHELDAARPRLLDPVRRVNARREELHARVALMHELTQAALAVPVASGPAGASSQPSAWQQAVALAHATYVLAVQLDSQIPALIQTDRMAAQAAEYLSQLYRGQPDPNHVDWDHIAGMAWRAQRNRTPYDVWTLLALTTHPASLDEQVGNLRDALRFLDTLSNEPEARFLADLWQRVLSGLAQAPGFAEMLRAFAAAAEPITPQTDLDALVASMAPEAHRLVAAWLALRGEFAAAAGEAARAAALYEPMQPRFPDLQPRALAEQARYLVLADPKNAGRAAELVRQALAALPEIQEQKYEAMTRPYRQRLIVYLVAAGDEAGARQALSSETGEPADSAARLADAYVSVAELYIRRPPGQRPAIAEESLRAALRQVPAHPRAWSWLAWVAAQHGDADGVELVLRQAGIAGVPAEWLDRIRGSLKQEFPGTQPATSSSPALESGAAGH